VETSAGLVLIDSGLEPDAHQLKKEMAALQLDWHSIHAILITHAHGDHCGGAEYLRRTTGARVYAGAGDAAILRTGGPREAFYSVFYVPDGLRPAATLVEAEPALVQAVHFHLLARARHVSQSVDSRIKAVLQKYIGYDSRSPNIEGIIAPRIASTR
jgi:glyoxylase-like metal-dependent hydrolase (beta-lactamase superfamily II)